MKQVKTKSCSELFTQSLYVLLLRLDPSELTTDTLVILMNFSVEAWDWVTSSISFFSRRDQESDRGCSGGRAAPGAGLLYSQIVIWNGTSLLRDVDAFEFKTLVDSMPFGTGLGEVKHCYFFQASWCYLIERANCHFSTMSAMTEAHLCYESLW